MLPAGLTALLKRVEYFTSVCTIHLDIDLVEEGGLNFTAMLINSGSQPIVFPENKHLSSQCLQVYAEDGERIWPACLTSIATDFHHVDIEPGGTQTIKFSGVLEEGRIIFSGPNKYALKGNAVALRFVLHRVESNERTLRLTPTLTIK